MIRVELYSDGKSKLVYGSAKTSFKKVVSELLIEKYKSFLHPKRAIDFLFFTPEMDNELFIVKVALSIEENLSVEKIDAFAKDLLGTVKDWSLIEYQFNIPTSLEVVTSNQTYFF